MLMIPNIYFCVLAVSVFVCILVISWLYRPKKEQTVFPLKRGECDTCGQHGILFDGLCIFCKKTYFPEEKQ
jgi:hypothetical protein